MLFKVVNVDNLRYETIGNIESKVYCNMLICRTLL